LKENPNDESRFLIKDPTRSGFFVIVMNVGFVYVGRCF